MPTSGRFLILLSLTIVVLLLVFSPGAKSEFHPAALSQHAQPAHSLPPQAVVVIKDGKLFHDAKCTYIHGKGRMISAAEAVEMGYSPCPRCMRKALGK